MDALGDVPGSRAGQPPLRVVVLADSFAFTDDAGPQLPDAPHLFPNVACDRLGVRLDRAVRRSVVARPGWGVRDVWTALTKDRHLAFEVVAGADALVLAVGSYDHLPAGVPAPVDALVPYVRPAPVRRGLRRVLRRANPVLIRLTGGRLPRVATGEFRRLYAAILLQLRGLAPGAAAVALGPAGQSAGHWAGRNPHLDEREELQLRLARRQGFATVPCRPLIAGHRERLNPDGIHWPAAAHHAVGTAVADALVAQLRGDAPRPPSAWDEVSE